MVGRGFKHIKQVAFWDFVNLSTWNNFCSTMKEQSHTYNTAKQWRYPTVPLGSPFLSNLTRFSVCVSRCIQCLGIKLAPASTMSELLTNLKLFRQVFLPISNQICHCFHVIYIISLTGKNIISWKDCMLTVRLAEVWPAYVTEYTAKQLNNLSCWNNFLYKQSST